MTTSTLAIPAPHTTAAQILTATGTGATLGTAALLLALWWFLHHKLAPKHHWIELGARLLLMAAVLALASTIGFGIGWITEINDWTARIINGWTQGKWGTSVGALTIVEAVLILVLGHHAWSLIRRRNDKGGARREASPGFDATEHVAHRYGFAAVGPLAATLPGALGATIAGSFMDLSVAIVHGFGHLVGI